MGQSGVSSGSIREQMQGRFFIPCVLHVLSPQTATVVYKCKEIAEVFLVHNKLHLEPI